MKQGNINRVDKGWALMQPELDKAFPPKKKKRLLPFLLAGSVMLIVAAYVLLTQNTTTSLSHTNNFTSTQSQFDNPTSLLNITNRETQAAANNKKQTVSTTPHLSENNNQNLAQAATRLELKQISQRSIKSQDPITDDAPLQKAETHFQVRLERSQDSELLEESNLDQAILNEVEINLLPTLDNEKLLIENTPMELTADYSPIEVGKLSNSYLAPKLKTLAVYNPSDNSLANEFLGGVSVSRSAWKVGLDLGVGYRTFSLQKIDSQNRQLNASPSAALDDELDQTTTSQEDISNTRGSLPRVEESNQQEVFKPLYVLGQISTGYTFHSWSIDTNLGLRWNRYQRQLYDNNPEGLLVSDDNTYNSTHLLAGTELGYKINNHLELGLGYRRNLAQTNVGKNYYTLSAGYTF